MLNDYLNVLAENLQRSVDYELSSHQDYIHFPNEELFDEEPVTLNVFLRDRKFLYLPPLSPKQYAFVEAGTQIYYAQTLEGLGWDLKSYIHTLVAMWGKGSGKDTVSRIILSRIAYFLCILKDPQRYFNMMPGDNINMLNVAYSSKQAQNIFFEPLKKMLGKSAWFRDKIDPHEEVIKFPKEVNLHSGHSEQESMEGNNLIASVADEIAAFKTALELEKRQRRSVRPLEHSADAIIKMLRSSSVSRFPAVYKLIMISYSRYEGDPITTAVEQYKNDPKAFVSVGATWEVNPTKKKEDFDEEYKRNPEQAAGMYECKPPKAVDAYFKQLTPELLEQSFPFRKLEDRPVDDQNKIASWVQGRPNLTYYGHVDLALNGDRAGLCVTHIAGERERAFVEKDDIGIISVRMIKEVLIGVDILTSFEAPSKGEIDIEQVRMLLVELYERRGFHFRLITYDGWNSAESIQQLNKKGIEAELFSVDRNTEAYDTLKDITYTGRLFGYRIVEDINDSIVVKELQHLTKIGATKIDHQLGGSKDEADALAAAVHHAVSLQLGMSSGEEVATAGSYETVFGTLDPHVNLNDWKGHGKFEINRGNQF